MLEIWEENPIHSGSKHGFGANTGNFAVHWLRLDTLFKFPMWLSIGDVLYRREHIHNMQITNHFHGRIQNLRTRKI